MLSIKDIQKIKSEKDRVRKETFREILKQFDKKIRYAVEVGDPQVFLSVPPLVIGYPMYDVNFATQYIARQLRLLGYTVKELGGPNMYVTWILKKTKQTEVHEEDPGSLPTLVNLKKVACEIRAKKK
jgi:hypothetical protein